MRICFVFALIVALTSPAFAWDPVGDITNPGRIIRNIERETKAAGRTLDQARIEAQVQAAAPAFQAWLEQSRNSARSGGTAPIPPHIRAQIEGYYDSGVLDRASFKIGDAGVFNLAALSIQYGGAAAVTLIDVIVFKSRTDAYNDVSLWVHELRHVKQFRDWGTRDFAIRYLRSWNSVEGEAYAAQRDFDGWRSRQVNAPAQLPYPDRRPPVLPYRDGPQQQAAAAVCATPWGMCQMAVAIPVGAPCYCPTYQGPLQGVGR